MSSLGDPIRRRVSGEDLLRTIINEILELKNRASEGKVHPQTMFAVDYKTVYLSHSEPVISTTTSLTDTYDSASAVYETSEYS